jgi:4-amino-4-deoxy-L-arabinose transferase-like glycosyltransferase
MSVKPFRSLGLRGPEPAPAVAGAPSVGSLPPRARRIAGVLGRVRLEIALLAGLAAVLNLWALSRNGFANDYYAAAARSMSLNRHDFLFASMDRSGVMSVDKPPLALWVQALSARIFGYGSLSLLVPQALMGIASVLFIYDLVRRRFGRLAGFVGGLTLALTPITVAISRHNNPDALLVLCCVAALWCGLRALEEGRTRWLVLAGVCVGLGFETKMLIALVVVPGLLAAWLWIAPRGRVKALHSLLVAGATMVLVGGAWPALVEFTPASSRPWVSGTSDDRVLSLIFEYNGLGRIDGQAGGPGGTPGGNVFGGTPGPLRLLNAALGGQAGWLLGFALVGGIALLIHTRLGRSDPSSGWLLAVGGAFAVAAVIFSYAKGIFHPYYVSLLAPFAAALTGAFVGIFAASARSARWLRIAGVAALLAGLGSELAVLHDYPGQLSWLTPLVACACTIATVAIAVLARGQTLALVLAGALGVLLLGPAIWSFDTLGHATSGTFPAGGPLVAETIGGPPGGSGGAASGLGFGGGRPSPRAQSQGQPLFGGSGQVPSRPGAGTESGVAPGGAAVPPLGAVSHAGPGAGAALGAPLGGGAAGKQVLRSAISYAKSHGGGTLAVSSQSTAASAIVAEDAEVAGIGGFSGRESDVSVSWLAMEVRTGRIRWVLSEGSSQRSGARLPGDDRQGATVAMAAVRRSCVRVEVGLGGRGASSSTADAGLPEATSEDTLYDCAGRSAALRHARATSTV